jgi:hypothetical protein
MQRLGKYQENKMYSVYNGTTSGVSTSTYKISMVGREIRRTDHSIAQTVLKKRASPSAEERVCSYDAVAYEDALPETGGQLPEIVHKEKS